MAGSIRREIPNPFQTCDTCMFQSKEGTNTSDFSYLIQIDLINKSSLGS